MHIIFPLDHYIHGDFDDGFIRRFVAYRIKKCLMQFFKAMNNCAHEFEIYDHHCILRFEEERYYTMFVLTWEKYSDLDYALCTTT